MHASASPRVRSSSPPSSAALSSALLFAALAAACGGDSGAGGQSGIPGQEGTKENGGFFIVDPNQSGGGRNVHLAEVLWGRLVDVHQIDANGKRVDPALFPDFVIDPTVASDGTNYLLDRNPVTQKERLTILNVHGPDAQDPDPDEDRFLTLLRDASEFLPLVTDKSDDPSESPPFTTVPRNACIVLRLDDCLDDDLNDDGVLDEDDSIALASLVQVFTGYPPITPYASRVLFDPNHGAKVGARFHSTRVLVDVSVSEIESNVAFPANAVGLPARQDSSLSANVSVRIPTRSDVGSGQPRVLTNLAGVPLDTDDNGPIDPGSFTIDVVRAMKAGSSEDESNGFLRDTDRPRVIGGWPITVTSAADDGAGDPGFDFILGLTFSTICLNAPAVGDVVTVGSAFAQVTQAAALTGSDVLGLRVRTVFRLDDASELMGTGLFQAPFHPSLTLADGCWVSFLPEPPPGGFPTSGIQTNAQIVARFSEPMDPETLSAFGGFRIVKGAGAASSTAIATNTVVGEVLLADADLTAFGFVPSSAMPHVQPSTETFHVELSDARDLAGNSLRHEIPFVDFTIASSQATARNSSIVLRFEAADEYGFDTGDVDPFGDAPDGLPDLRGQFFYDEERGMLLPRPVSFAGYPVDQNNPVPALMLPVAGGVFTPLNPLGAKLQTLWRYCDMGWDVRDETKYNLDVIGINWSPSGGVLSDFYDQFEILLGHSRFLPDEASVVLTTGLPTTPFDDNYLAGSNPDPLIRGGVSVHNRALGYAVNPAARFTATTGTIMMPFPLNQGVGTDVTYTWRDTSILTLGADGDPTQAGIPLRIEALAGLIGPMQPGTVAGPGMVPSFGLPLLMEFRCHPSDQGLGFNLFGITIGNMFNSPVPPFRAYSLGATDTAGNTLFVLPDAEPSPRGQLGAPPPNLMADSIFYLGQLDTVVRISRVHTIWLDAGTTTPLWRAPLLEPPLSSQPLGTGILIDYRAAVGFSTGGNQPFDSSKLNAYGNPVNANDPQPQGLTGWSRDITIANSMRFMQVRLTFINDITTGVGPELGALALRYDIQ